MCYLHVFEIDLRVVGHLLLMLCCYALSEISMNWFINGGMMEKLAVLGGERGRRLIKWWENISGKGLKIQHQFYQYIGSKIATKSWWGKVLATWILGWIMVSLCTFWHLNSQGIEKRKETLASMCDERARMLQDQFNVSLNHIQALSILISTFHHSKTPSAIDQTTFARYTERTTFERPLTSGVAYAVRVLHSEREEFEKQQGWTIKRMDALEQTPVHEDDYVAEISQTSPVQDEYAPVIFAQETISHVISLDMLSGKEDRENVIRARESGKGVLTAPFRLLKSNRLGVILTFAVYKSELPSNATPNERIQVTDGYLGGVFDIEALVEKLLHQLASKQKILVNVDDTTNTSHPISMYGSNVTEDGMYHTSSLNFGDPFRKHEMCCRFKQKPPWPWQAILTSIGILIIALLLGYICHATVNRIAKVEEDFHKMMELKRLAEAADVAKSQFLATVSHEIRTPMNGVLGMLQMLMDTELDITQQDYVRTAQGSGKALVSLINEVLDQARVESGKLELEAVRFDPRSILDEVLSLFSGKAQKKGIELAVYISDQVPECLIGDPGRFRQIITNLMGNSIKFTDKGHIFVMIHLVEEVMTSIGGETEASSKNTLSGFPVADRGRSWRGFKSCSQEGSTCPSSFSSKSLEFINLIVSVEDTGTGIPAEAESRVFTPFMQVGPSISRIHGGTGIGLSISKCLVALMKGEIGFASEPQVGSTFTFTAVFTNGHLKLPDQKNQQINKQPKSVPSEFQGMAALVVDPRLVRAKVTRYHLQRLGIHVEVASDLNLGITYLNSRTMIVNMVLVEKEAWEKDHDLSNDFVTKLRDYDHSEPIRLFLLATSIVSTKTSTAKSASYTPIVIMKPLRASMLAASLQRAMGVGNKGTSRNGGLPVQSLENLLHGKLILVVDDNKVNLKVAAGALKKYGAKVECAESGKKAIALLKPPHNFDACFMDIQMPEMDGFEATKRIRNMECNVNDRIQLGEACAEDYANISNWHVPILAMTADVIQATHEECLKFEMDGYVSKPFEGEQLYREVARFVKSNSAHDQ